MSPASTYRPMAMIVLRPGAPATGFDAETGRGFDLPDVGATSATPSTELPVALPAAFDPVAFINDLHDAGYVVSAARWISENRDDEWIPSLRIEPPEGCGFRRDYADIMRKWADAIDACPDYLKRTVDYVFAPRETRLAGNQKPLGGLVSNRYYLVGCKSVAAARQVSVFSNNTT